MVTDDFPTRFAETLRNAGETLEDKGYTVHGYEASILDYDLLQHSDAAETPEEALEDVLDTAADGDKLKVALAGETLRDAVYGDDDLEDIIYYTVRGQINLENPTTDQFAEQDEPLDYEIPGIETVIRYIPDEDDGSFEILHEQINPPYTVEDAHERSNDIVTTLQEAGFEAKRYN
jgi:hypothetical protein